MDVLIFEPQTHSYISPETDIDWISVTTLLSNFKKPFDGKSIAAKSAKNAKGKWYGMSVEDIQKAWKAEADRACDLGTYYHNQREEELLSFKTIVQQGIELPVIPPIYDEQGRKMAPSQKLGDGIYPEHMVYLRSVGVCGQSDLVEVIDGKVYITDYKTNKEIKRQSYKNWEGISEKMLGPCSHLDDCNYNHYNLQLSIYMYMILKHNPKLEFGDLIIRHVTFHEKDQKDMYGFPVTLQDENGKPIVKDSVEYHMPYLRDEVISIMHAVQDNPYRYKKRK